jgi:hypothetical protein
MEARLVREASPSFQGRLGNMQGEVVVIAAHGDVLLMFE